MDLKAFPLNQVEYSYNAQDVMKYYAGRNSGVFETGDNLKVSVDSNMQIKVATGTGWLSKDFVASVAFWNDSVKYLIVEAGDDTYDRYDLVVVSWDFIQAENSPQVFVRKGTPSSSPAVPSLVNDDTTIEIALAKIYVAKGAVSLSDSNITDLRGDDSYCPLVYAEQTIREEISNCVGYGKGSKKISGFTSGTPASSDKILFENGGVGKSATLADLPISTKVQNALNGKANSSHTHAISDVTNLQTELDNTVGYGTGKKISEFTSVTPTASDKILIEQNGAGKSTTISNAVNTCSLTLEEIKASTDLTGKVASANALKDIISIFRYHSSGDSLSLTISKSCLLVINGAGNDNYYMGILISGNTLDMIISSGTYDSSISYDENTGLLILPTSGYYRYAIIY